MNDPFLTEWYHLIYYLLTFMLEKELIPSFTVPKQTKTFNYNTEFTHRAATLILEWPQSSS